VTAIGHPATYSREVMRVFEALIQEGLAWMETTPGMRYGANRDLRTRAELVYIFERPLTEG
jgi:hypothetical protein